MYSAAVTSVRLFVLTWVIVVAAPAVSAEREVEVVYQNGSLKLGGVLLLPNTSGPYPAVVVIRGSGPSDRKNPWARTICQELVGQGVAVLLADKRGSGASAGDWRTASFDDLAADALAAVEFLKRRDDIIKQRIGLLGLSQGGWIAPIAAAKSADVGFVINISGAAVSYAEQTFAEMANTARQAGLNAHGIQQVVDLNREAGRYLATSDWAPYARMRDAALRSNWRRIAEGFPATSDAPIWTFLRSVATFDPMPYWILLSQPVFVAYGELDEEDNVPVRESVRRLEFGFAAAGKSNYEIIVAPGVGHAIWNESRQFAPIFITSFRAWVRRYVLTDTRSTG